MAKKKNEQLQSVNAPFTPAFQSIPGLTDVSTPQPVPESPKLQVNQQRLEAGTDFIREREILRSKGFSRKDATNFAEKIVSQRDFSQFNPREVAERKRLAGEIGNVPPVGESPSQPLFSGSNIGEASVDALTGAGLGALAGGAGAVGGLGVGKGVVAGLGIGFVRGLVQSKKEETLQNIKNQYTDVQNAAKEMDNILDLARIPAEQGGFTPSEAVNAYNENLQKIMQAESELKRITNDDLNAWLSDGDKGGDELKRITAFLTGSERRTIEVELGLIIQNKLVEQNTLASASFPTENSNEA